ncbi:MAG: DedA family protein [Candidatus Aenigmarchaeota archaeon]|nr:DedA family protein [Candidatus Aenigmarchaeota archaeon]
MLFEQLSEIFTGLIGSTGYFGIFVLMALESMVAPVPSELVMPFTGFLVADGKMNFLLVVLISSFASIVGSLISYFIAYYGKREMVHRFGRLFLLDKAELNWTEKWFRKHGDSTVFISRFIPVVRHLISLPAGLARMNLRRFIGATLAGATMWNTFLLWAGMQLRENWGLVRNYSEWLDIIIVLAVLLAAAFVAWKHANYSGLKPRAS